MKRDQVIIIAVAIVLGAGLIGGAVIYTQHQARAEDVANRKAQCEVDLGIWNEKTQACFEPLKLYPPAPAQPTPAYEPPSSPDYAPPVPSEPETETVAPSAQQQCRDLGGYWDDLAGACDFTRNEWGGPVTP